MVPNDNENMVEPKSIEDLKKVLIKFQNDNSSGSDGWSMEFFQVMFELINNDLLNIIEETKYSDHIPASFISTFLAQIPKSADPYSFDDLFPISLYNCIYKIISKPIALWLKPILSKSI